MNNLTGTSWSFNNAPTLPNTDTDYDINFISAGVLFDTFSYNDDGIYYGKGQTSLKVYDGSVWVNDEYKKAEIEDGDDANNATLIALLPTLAVQTTQFVSKGNLRAYTEKMKAYIAENSGAENENLAFTLANGSTLNYDGSVSASVNSIRYAGLINFTTSAPTAANPSGLSFVVLTSEPATRYAGWIYIITEV